MITLNGSDIPVIISALGTLLTSVVAGVVTLMSLKVNRIEKHTDGLVAKSNAASEDKGRQAVIDEQSGVLPAKFPRPEDPNIKIVSTDVKK